MDPQVISDPAQFRKNIIHAIGRIVRNPYHSINIEKSIYNFTIEECDKRNIMKSWSNLHYVTIYISKFKMIYFNIKRPEILKNIHNKTIKCQNIAYMKHTDLLLKSGRTKFKIKKLGLKINISLKLKRQQITLLAENVNQKNVLIINFKPVPRMNL